MKIYCLAVTGLVRLTTWAYVLKVRIDVIKLKTEANAIDLPSILSRKIFL